MWHLHLENTQASHNGCVQSRVSHFPWKNSAPPIDIFCKWQFHPSSHACEKPGGNLPLFSHPIPHKSATSVGSPFKIWQNLGISHPPHHYYTAIISSFDPCHSSPCAELRQSCPTLCDRMDRSPPSSCVHGDSPGQSTGGSCHALLQRILPPQGWNLRSSVSCTGREFTSSATQGVPTVLPIYALFLNDTTANDTLK